MELMNQEIWIRGQKNTSTSGSKPPPTWPYGFCTKLTAAFDNLDKVRRSSLNSLISSQDQDEQKIISWWIPTYFEACAVKKFSFFLWPPVPCWEDYLFFIYFLTIGLFCVCICNTASYYMVGYFEPFFFFFIITRGLQKPEHVTHHTHSWVSFVIPTRGQTTKVAARRKRGNGTDNEDWRVLDKSIYIGTTEVRGSIFFFPISLVFIKI